MSIVLGLILASALTQATPATPPGGWITDLDYPDGAFQRREQGRVAFSLLVSPQGNAERCHVTQSSGFPELDEKACITIMSRARFKPATDENGQPAYNIFRGSMVWRHPTTNIGFKPDEAKPLPPDLELQVNKLPGGAKLKQIGLLVRIDETGHIAHCEPSGGTRDVKLVTIACAQAESSYATVEKDDKGTPISLIKTFNVVFKTDPL